MKEGKDLPSGKVGFGSLANAPPKMTMRLLDVSCSLHGTPFFVQQWLVHTVEHLVSHREAMVGLDGHQTVYFQNLATGSDEQNMTQ